MRICRNCHTENENDFLFCKNCGAEISGTADYDFRGSNENFSYNNTDSFSLNDFDGVSKEEMTAYLGKNYYKFLPKFSAMQIKNSKTSFSVIVFILTFFFGFLGGAVWFLYRKMYKIGVILLIAGIIFNMAAITLNGNYISTDISSALSGYSSDGNSIDNPDILPRQGTVNRSDLSRIFDYADNLIENIAGSILLSVFALYLYKQKAISDIKKIKGNQYTTGNSETMFSISIAGGTNAGAAVIGVILALICIFSFNAVLVNPLRLLLNL